MILTDKEIQVLTASRNTDYGDSFVEPVWSIAVSASANMTPKTYGGVASSLIKKELIIIYPYEGSNGGPKVFSLTQKGKEVILEKGIK
jgi:hypothetical protein